MSATAVQSASNPIDDKTVFYLEEEPHHEEGSSTMLGFWLYLMSDCLIFAMLFAVFGVLGGNYAAGPGPKARALPSARTAALAVVLTIASSLVWPPPHGPTRCAAPPRRSWSARST